MKKTIFSLFISILFPTLAAAQTQAPVSYFGATPDLKVSGKEFVDPSGKAVTLHGVMDTPNCYFNGGRWGWINYNTASTNDINACKNYFKKVFEAITKKGGQGSTYCNLFRLHLDPAWLRNPNYIAPNFTNVNDNAKTATDPNGNSVFDEANICHFSFDKMRTRMNDLYVPIIKDALAHGLYVVVRPPGVFPEDVKVGDYYNTYLTTVWDIVSNDSYIKANSGKIMLELGNEPVRMSGTLADYFQPIVNKIRSNGFTGIILLPGTGWQANYTNYNTKPISDSNYGYAVHCYPSWYGEWDGDHGVHAFIQNFEQNVPIDKKPIVITEVDWSPMTNSTGHWNEAGTVFVPGNYGTWGTGTTTTPTSGVAVATTENIAWGDKYKALIDKHPNISWTLQGTSTYVDMDRYLRDGTVQPAFIDAMKADGYPNADQACSGTCFKWFYQYACGDRVPYGEVVEPEPELPTGSAVGNAAYKNGHYEFYTPNYSAFIFDQYKGTPLVKCAEFTLNLGEGSTIGYRLDVQLKDANGNVIKYIDQNGTEQNYILGSKDKGTRLTDPTNKTFDFQTIFASYLEQYPGCTVGEIRLNTVVSTEDTGREGKYWFTIDKMEMNKSEVTARTGTKGTSLADVKMYKHESTKNVVVNDDAETAKMGGWGGTITRTAGAGMNGSYCYVLTNEKTNTWESQVNYEGTYPNGTEYTLSMDIKGASSGSLPVNIQKAAGNVVCWQGTINYTTEWQTVSVPVTINGEGADRLLFDYGGKSTLYIDNVQLYTGSDKATEITGPNIKLGEAVAEVFGAGLMGNVTWNEYADLSAYNKMIIKGTGGSLRVLYNRPATGDCPELNPSLASGEAIVDLSAYPYFHLNSIKAAWEQTVNVSSITLIDGSGNNVDIADYYITGAGHITDAAQAALDDVKATVIDATGLTNINPWSLSTANPNCLIIYKEDNQVGFTWNETTRNLVKNSGGYSAYRTNLYDGFDFRAPFAFNTVGGASYTRELTTEWATIALPFELNVATAGSTEIYQLTAVDSEKMVFTKVESGTIVAGSVILYRNESMGETTLSGKNIAQTVEGFNIQPLAGVNGWFTAQSFTNRVIDDVATDPVLKDYDVYGVQADKFVHATKKVTLKPFRAFFLVKKGTQAAPKASYLIATDIEATGISSTPEVQAPAAYYDISGRRINSSAKSGIVIIRKADGTVRKIVK